MFPCSCDKTMHGAAQEKEWKSTLCLLSALNAMWTVRNLGLKKKSENKSTD